MDNRNRDRISKDSMGSTSAGNVNKDVSRKESESSQFGTLCILPLTQCQISCPDILRDLCIERIEFLRSLKLR